MVIFKNILLWKDTGARIDLYFNSFFGMLVSFLGFVWASHSLFSENSLKDSFLCYCLKKEENYDIKNGRSELRLLIFC